MSFVLFTPTKIEHRVMHRMNRMIVRCMLQHGLDVFTETILLPCSGLVSIIGETVFFELLLIDTRKYQFLFVS